MLAAQFLDICLLALATFKDLLFSTAVYTLDSASWTSMTTTTTMTMTEKKTPPRAWTTPAQSDAVKQEDGPNEFSGSIKVSQKPPRRSDLERVANLPVLNAAGVSIPFQNLYTSSDKPRRVMIIFIRHFFCGVSSLPK